MGDVFDYIVVGSGSAGAAVAARLSVSLLPGDAPALQAANLIGHGVLVKGNHVQLVDGKSILGVELDEDALDRNPYRPPGARVAGTVGGLPDRFVGDR